MMKSLLEYRQGNSSKIEKDRKYHWDDDFDAKLFWEEELDVYCHQLQLILNARFSEVIPTTLFDLMSLFTDIATYNLIDDFSLYGNLDNCTFYENLAKAAICGSNRILKGFSTDYENLIISKDAASAWNRYWRISEKLRSDIHFEDLYIYIDLTPFKCVEMLAKTIADLSPVRLL